LTQLTGTESQRAVTAPCSPPPHLTNHVIFFLDGIMSLGGLLELQPPPGQVFPTVYCRKEGFHSNLWKTIILPTWII